ncbi:MAG: hypothetical protein WBD13_23145, partial [Burkholderiaceae bacterium]
PDAAFRPDQFTGVLDEPGVGLGFLSVSASANRIAWMVLPVAALIVGALLWLSSGVLTFQDDAAQYLSTASHLLAGDGLRTSVMYYDSQLEQQAPAIQTVWPAGLPILTAVVSAISGLPVDRSLLFIVILAHIGTSGLLLLTARLMGLGRWLALSLAGFWLMFVPSWLSVARGLSEPLFQFFSMLAVVAIACYFQPWQQRASLARGRAGLRWVLLASLAVMMAVLVRYQAVALIAPLFAAMTIGRFQAQPLARRLTVGLLVCIAPVGLVGLLFLRNYWVTGSLTGGAASGRGQTLADVASNIGWVPPSLQMLTLVALIVSAFGCSILAAVLWLRDSSRTRSAAARCHPATRATLVFCLGAYAANITLILYLCLTSTAYVIVMRYMEVCLLFLLPPFVWGLTQWIGAYSAASLAGDRDHQLAQYGLVASIGVATLVQLASLHPGYVDRLETAPPNQLQRILMATRVNGEPAMKLLTGKRGMHPVLMSTHAHALSLLTDSTVVGVPIPIYTPRKWDEATIRDLAYRHSVSYLVAFRRMDTWVYRDLINKMLDENRCLVWLEPIVANHQLVIARVDSKNRVKRCALPFPPPEPTVQNKRASGRGMS